MTNTSRPTKRQAAAMRRGIGETHRQRPEPVATLSRADSQELNRELQARLIDLTYRMKTCAVNASSLKRRATDTVPCMTLPRWAILPSTMPILSVKLT